MRYIHHYLTVAVTSLAVTSPTLLIVGTVNPSDVLRDWAIWLLGPTAVTAIWLLLWDHRQRIVERVGEMLGSAEEQTERLAESVARALAQDRTTSLRR